MYAIMCDARKGQDIGVSSLALVSRSKSKRYWWTSDSPALVMAFEKKSAAEFQAKRYKKNRPRVVEYALAIQLIKSQGQSISRNQRWLEEEKMYEAGMEACEMGWDDHKSY